MIASLNPVLPPSFKTKSSSPGGLKELTKAETELIKARNEHENDPNDNKPQIRSNEAHKALNSLISI